jgi:hypothetical protein
MSMVVRTRVFRPNGRSASNAVDSFRDDDLLDAASAGWPIILAAIVVISIARTLEALETNSEAADFRRHFYEHP